MIPDCWNRIGVSGDGSCTELAEHVHCRNCPVYQRAAVELLDRPLWPEYLHEWTARVAAPLEVGKRGGASALVFRVGAEWLALPTGVFVQVTEHSPVHSLPHRRSDAIAGIANVRGELIVVARLGVLLGIRTGASPPAPSAAARERFLVIARGGHRVACPVDEVEGLLRYHPSDLAAVPATLSSAAVHYSRGVLGAGSRAISLLDEGRLFEALNASLV